jgi:glyoxylase-like metal-dependent hydrolase (beta-lactamase superfamily II)
MTDAPQSDEIPFDRSMDAPSEEIRQVSPMVRRMVAGNAGPFTFTGTCTYIVGKGQVAVIDPGPADQKHIDALLVALRGESVSHIVITHTHRDHSPAARAIQAATGAKIIGCAPHRAARELNLGEASTMEGSNDLDYAPDQIMSDGDVFSGQGFTLTALATPGHTMNHLAFALNEERTIFSGDHVMAWSTSIVAPPDGSMGHYMASLDKLRGRDEAIYWPGHGGPVNDPQRFVRALAHHRRQREASILNRLHEGDAHIPVIVEKIYENLDPRLKGAAALSVFAHVEDLVTQGRVRAHGPVTLATRYEKI